ncbi:MAG TPA: hypothetical protein VGU71_03495 [Candidatus Dormibacteraeota bacterium]|nr:hypothetical protein [Candidatus Dormibacteraeota bacterium]
MWQSLLVGWQDVAPSDEVEAADWIHGRLHPFAQDVGSVVPMGFGAYARIFHPASGAERPGIEVRWSYVAAWNGKIAHPEMQFHAIAAPAHDRAPGPESRIYQPRDGVLSERQAGALVDLLSKHTATPDACWLCLWEGYGYLNPGATAAWLIEASPRRRPKPPGFGFGRLRFGMPKTTTRGFPERKRVKLPGRDYLLFKGSVAEARGWEDGPNLWWPDDQAWCVASEIDFPYTYVGGTSELIEQILQHPALEALPATIDHRITAMSDTINS